MTDRPSAFFAFICRAISVGLLLVAPAHAGTARDAKEPVVSFVVQESMVPSTEGPDVRRSWITIAGRRMCIGFPPNCRVTGDPACLTLNLKDSGVDGEIQVRRSPFPAGTDFVGKTKELRAEADKQVPAGVTRLEPQNPKLNPFPFNGWKGIGFSWRYVYYGRPIVKTLAYVDLVEGVQIEVSTVASEQDARKVEETTRQFMASWFVLDR